MRANTLTRVSNNPGAVQANPVHGQGVGLDLRRSATGRLQRSNREKPSIQTKEAAGCDNPCISKWTTGECPAQKIIAAVIERAAATAETGVAPF